MNSKEALENIKALLKTEAFLAYEDIQKELKVIAKDIELLEILKNRMHLKEDTLPIDSPVFSIFKEITNEKKNTDIAWVEVSGFVFRNSNEYKLLKERLEDDK